MEWQCNLNVKVERHTETLNLQRDNLERLLNEKEDRPVQHCFQAVLLLYLTTFERHVGVQPAGSGPHLSPQTRRATL